MPNTRIAAAGTFSVSSGAAAVGNVIAFTNSTMAPVTGTVTITRAGLTPSPTFPLDLEPGETRLLRNITLNTSYTFAGEVAHTRVGADLVFQPEARYAAALAATGQCTVPTEPDQALVFAEIYS